MLDDYKDTKIENAIISTSALNNLIKFIKFLVTGTNDIKVIQ